MPPFNWKRSLLIVLIMDGVFLIGLFAALVTRQPGAFQASIGGLAVGVIVTIAIGVFGPLFAPKATSPKVECPQHGEQVRCLVCEHIVEGLRQGRSVGFFWSREDDSPCPDAWCSDCEARRVREPNGEWVGEAVEKLGAKILCGKCYELAKALTFPD
jgi:hypothetical protein